MAITNGTLIKQGRYWHWKYQLDGETRWESLKVESKREALLLRQKRIAEYHENADRFSKTNLNPRLDDFEQTYFRWAEDHKRPKTLEIERNFWQQLRDFTGARRLKDIKRQHVERFKQRLKRKGMRGKPLKDESINDALRHLQAIFNHAIKLKLFDGENPFIGVERYKIPKTQPTFLKVEEIERLLAVANNYSQALYWLLMLGIYAGMRKNEMVNARWEWFDFEKKLIRIQRHEGFELKDNEERTVPLSARLHTALYPHRKEQGFLFTSNRPSAGRSRYRYEPKKALKATAEKAEVEGVNFQILRHTFGSQHAINGTSLYKISKWMGHSSVNVTSKHYAGLQDYDSDIDRF